MVISMRSSLEKIHGSHAPWLLAGVVFFLLSLGQKYLFKTRAAKFLELIQSMTRTKPIRRIQDHDDLDQLTWEMRQRNRHATVGEMTLELVTVRDTIFEFPLVGSTAPLRNGRYKQNPNHDLTVLHTTCSYLPFSS